MPALTMRGRYLMREYWTDSALFLRLTPAERELYIGLWMLADDEGWMPRDVPAIAASLYRFEDHTPREERVTAGLLRLRALGKLESHRCCLFLPAVVRYPRAGKKSGEHAAEHRKHSAGSKGIQTHSGASPVPSRPYPSQPSAGGRAHEPRRPRGNGPAAPAAEEEPSEFSQRVPRPPGGDP